MNLGVVGVSWRRLCFLAMDENEGVPPSSEIEEDTNFTVHEEEEDEEERIEEEAEDGEETNHAQSAERGLNGSTEESTHQLVSF